MASMKLYVWEDVLTDWTSGVAFAFAETAIQARQMIARKYADSFNDPEFAGAHIATMLKELSDRPTIVKTPQGFYCAGGG